MKGILIILILAFSAASAQDTPALETGQACETCHVSDDWKSDAGAKFEHQTTGFELLGSHADLKCSACHPGSSLEEKHQFDRVDSECSSCHEDVHRDQWGQDCGRCHNSTEWTLSNQDQNHDLTRFPLNGPHRSLACEQCHVSNPGTSSSLPVTCLGCHRSNYTDSADPSHTRLVLSMDCEGCHGDQAMGWSPSQFDHLSTGFALLGMHAEVECATCHTQAVSNTAPDCAACHLTDYQSSITPAHAEQGYPTDCATCHSSFNWRSTFTHAQTGFALNGAHAATQCRNCHVNGQFENLVNACSACHLDGWVQTTNPSHYAAGFSQTCQLCHTDISWKPSSWVHDTETDYPLTGRHVSASCEQCHLTAPYSAQSTDCYDCHRADFEASQEPDHLEANIPQTCQVCHTTANWESEEIDHSLTEFPLEGAHVEVLCETCHETGYDLPIICEGCHLPAYESTASGVGPDHALYLFDKDCSLCHDQSKWAPSFYDHNVQSSGYALKGQHLDLLPDDCIACHVDNAWSDIPVVCEGCHQSNFTETSDPDHSQEGYPENLCAACHTEAGWEPSIFAHQETGTSCETCHMVQYAATASPPHETFEFQAVCIDCHTVTAWSPSSFAHNEINTGFLLAGNHVNLDCNVCHSSWEPSTEVRSCASASCHLDQYQSSVDPPHAELGFPLTCMDCHSEAAWSPSSFVHDQASTGFNLDGSHQTIGCVSCHSDWEPAPEVRSCSASSCHLDQYQATSNPPHELMGLSPTCQDCHTTTAWQPAGFEHDVPNTGFALEGAHTSANCQQCHSPWQLNPVVRTCAHSSCHLSDYQNTNDPAHAAASFPLECETCHSLTAWEPATFDHDGQYFPIYSGQHLNEWNECSQCHANSGDYADFTCFAAGCHTPTSENNNHFDDGSWVSCNGQTYNSAGVTSEECFFCHPTGDEDDCESGGDSELPFRPRFLPTKSDKDWTD